MNRIRIACSYRVHIHDSTDPMLIRREQDRARYRALVALRSLHPSWADYEISDAVARDMESARN